MTNHHNFVNQYLILFAEWVCIGNKASALIYLVMIHDIFLYFWRISHLYLPCVSMVLIIEHALGYVKLSQNTLKCSCFCMMSFKVSNTSHISHLKWRIFVKSRKPVSLNIETIKLHDCASFVWWYYLYSKNLKLFVILFKKLLTEK